MSRHLAYLRYVLRHKWFVFLAGLRYGVPLHQLVIHDWGKFLPSEWLPYARTFYKADGSKQYDETPAFAAAWNAHQKRHRHHWQAWLLTWDRGETVALEMPERFAREMVADWTGAGRAILGYDDTQAWYIRNRERIRLHDATRRLVENLLGRGSAPQEKPEP